jgi:hypothetical protein
LRAAAFNLNTRTRSIRRRADARPAKIILLPGQSAAEEFATLAHETGHALLHGHARRSETTKTVRETEAEAVASVVCEAVGLKADNSADHIQLYSGDKETAYNHNVTPKICF